MNSPANRRRDVWAGGLVAMLGVGTLVEARHYDLGSLTEMGPGFLPTVLACILIGVGMLIALGIGGTDDAMEGLEALHTPLPPIQWRGGAAIALGVVAFMVLGAYGGLLPAVFGCVFIAALGDRTTSWIGAAILAAVVAVLGSILFVYVLKVSFPLVRW